MYRISKPEERDECIRLADSAFGFDSEALLPKIYAPSLDTSSIHKVAVNEEGKICAQAAVLPQSVIIGNVKLRAGFLGMVSVHQDSRGLGHMKNLMNIWLEEAPEKYDMLVLWGQRQRYEYFGFTSGGIYRQYVIEKPNIHHGLKDVACEKIRFCPYFDAGNAAAFAEKLNKTRKSYVERTEQEIPLLFHSLKQKATAVLVDEKLTGYIISDNSGTNISEFALTSFSDIKPVIKAYFHFIQCERISICVPDYEKKLNAVLAEFSEQCLISSDCMYNIFDYANVLEAYLKLKYESVGLSVGEFSAILDKQAVTIEVNKAGVKVRRNASSNAVRLDKMQAQALLISEYGHFHDIAVNPDWFPLPLFWYTVDKI